jgi:hypothetical protein
LLGNCVGSTLHSQESFMARPTLADGQVPVSSPNEAPVPPLFSRFQLFLPIECSFEIKLLASGKPRSSSLRDCSPVAVLAFRLADFAHCRRMVWASTAAGVLLIVGTAMSGCGGGSTVSTTSTGGGTTPPPSSGTATGTPAGTYMITVTATTGSGANAVSRKTNLTLVVQ